MTSEEAAAVSIPQKQQYTHSLKLEETAKGIRISVHVYVEPGERAVEFAAQQAFDLYQEAQHKARELSIPMAPMESVKENK